MSARVEVREGGGSGVELRVLQQVRSWYRRLGRPRFQQQASSKSSYWSSVKCPEREGH